MTTTVKQLVLLGLGGRPVSSLTGAGCRLLGLSNVQRGCFHCQCKPQTRTTIKIRHFHRKRISVTAKHRQLIRTHRFDLTVNRSHCITISSTSRSYTTMDDRDGDTVKPATFVKAVLVDLSGTLHIDDTEIPASVDALQRLRDAGVQVRFVTNTTKESERMLLNRLQKLGFNIDLSEIFTSLSAARRLIQAQQYRPLLLIDDAAKEDFEGIHVTDPNAVVIGLAPDSFDYKNMNDAFRLILEGAPLIAIHKSRYYKKKDGLALGPGPFVTALEYATETKAQVVGKPEKSFFIEALSDLNCQPHEAIMIGDDVRADVAGAQEAGMLGILVKTGKYMTGDENKICPVPDAVCDDFNQAVDHILAIL